MSESGSPPIINEALLHATVKWNTLLFAGICGLSGALTLLCITYISLFRGLPNPGHYLNLLGVFLPGYKVSAGGAWIGFVWGGLLGAVSGALIYRIYALSIRRQVADYFAGDKSEDDLEFVTMKIYGHSLGLALGSLAALGVLITTNLLVARGTADESVHAALASQYLPGYSVSVSGSILGAVGIWIVIYVSCLLLGVIYNGVAGLRQRGNVS